MEIIEFRNAVWEYFRYLRLSMDFIFRPIVEDLGLTMLQARILVEVQAAGEITLGIWENPSALEAAMPQPCASA